LRKESQRPIVSEWKKAKREIERKRKRKRKKEKEVVGGNKKLRGPKKKR